MLDPVLAAAAVGVAVDVDGQRFGGLDGAGEQGGEKDERAHGGCSRKLESAEHTPPRRGAQTDACFRM
ncbi:hypothetical protein D3C80_1836710 [compost metagenome]